jgi:hypothetical protein
MPRRSPASTPAARDECGAVSGAELASQEDFGAGALTDHVAVAALEFWADHERAE